MKIVKESLEEGDIQGISESGGFRFDGTTYDVLKTGEGVILAGEQGILGHKNTLISWETLKRLIQKYSA
jgi:hypothetical protein